jgi:xyloglucan-specific exo-beta-1,4-glucanase
VKKFITLLWLFLTSAIAGATPHGQMYATTTGCNCWSQTAIGGGGVTDGLSIANDGTKVSRDDGGEIYLNTGTGWNPVITTSSMPSGDVSYGSLQTSSGVTGAVVAKSNSQYLYALINGWFYHSSNQATTWTKSSRTQDSSIPGNTAPYKLYNQHIAVDPQNPTFVLIGSGVLLTKSTDGGVTNTAISTGTIPAPTTAAAGNLICFDPSGGTSGGLTKNIYVTSYGNGTYFSNDSGATWHNVTGSGPTTFVRAFCDQSGNFWAIDATAGGGAYGAIWKFTGGLSGTWASVLSGLAPSDVAVNPANASNVVAFEGTGNGGNGGTLDISNDGGSTWLTTVPSICQATDVPWLQGGMSGSGPSFCFGGAGNIAFDPSQTNYLVQGGEAGLWYGNPPSTNVQFTWHSITKYLENLSPRWLIAPPNTGGGYGYPIMFAGDIAAWTITNLGTYANQFGPLFVANTVAGYGGDWASSSPGTIAVLSNQFACTSENSGKSSDGGQTWSQFGSKAFCSTNSTIGGCIAASTPTNFVILPIDNSTANNGPWNTTNGGAAWAASAVAGGVATTGPNSGWGGQIYTASWQCVADRVTANKFYLTNLGGSGTTNGVWASTNSGANFSQVDGGSFNTNCINGSGSFVLNSQLRSVPGIAGALIWTHGDTGVYPDTGSSACYSLNGGATWTTLANIESAISIGLGKAGVGHSGPTVWFIGWYNLSGTYTFGLWRSLNFFDGGTITWQCQGTCANGPTSNGFVLGLTDTTVAIEGDPNVYGRLYAATHGTGYGYWQSQNFLLNRDLNPASNDNSPAFMLRVG